MIGPAAIIVCGFALCFAAGQPASRDGDTPAPGQAAALAQPSAFEASLAEIDRGIAKVEDLRADFTQLKHTPLLKKPLRSTGTLLVRGDRVRWDTRKPHPSTMTIAGAEVRIYYPDAKIVEVYTADGEMRRIAASPLPRLAELRERFTITELRAGDVLPGADPQRHLAALLEPRSNDLKEHIERIRVVIDRTIPCIVLLEVTDPDGERTAVELSEVRINSGVTDAELTLAPPAGVREVRPGGGGK